MRPLEPLGAPPVLEAGAESEAERVALGAESDPPVSQRDALAVSSRVRALLATLRPAVVRVRGFWDHVVRRVALSAGRALEIDPSGSYRLRLG